MQNSPAPAAPFLLSKRKQLLTLSVSQLHVLILMSFHLDKTGQLMRSLLLCHNPVATGQRQTLTVERSAHFSLR